MDLTTFKTICENAGAFEKLSTSGCAKVYNGVNIVWSVSYEVLAESHVPQPTPENYDNGLRQFLTQWNFDKRFSLIAIDQLDFKMNAPDGVKEARRWQLKYIFHA